ncbi:hypothetical protein AZE42_04750 [Rhizopogon vesiculosus]|uniref:MARVEL domain-containing protein n=1 Tax=Rhizopogon vesiculosus TaxID=180088 RepID=A0A1J8PS08_9AGAM|nr:hypothetical protein AZE42_04750 [Rhizopogon vesiculosus]
MPFTFALFRGLLFLAIGICNVTSIVISVLAFVAKTGGPFEVLATTSSGLALLILPIMLMVMYCRRGEEASNTLNLVTFGALCLVNLVSSIGLTVHARHDPAADLCHDFSGNCTLAHTLVAMSYLSVIFSLIGFIISHIDKYPGVVKVSPRYPITKAPSSRFAALQYPLDVEMDNVYTQHPARKAKHARKTHVEEERWTDIPV